MKEFAKKILSDVSAVNEFVLHYEGKVRKIKNLIDLRIELENMSVKEFSHHVNSDKNDFSVWVKDCVGDPKLAKDMSHADNKNEVLDLIKSRVDFAITILEKENESLIKDEMKQLKKISSKVKNKPKLSSQIKLLEKDIKRSKEVSDIEKKLLNEAYDNDFEIIPWEKLNPIPANARIAEFVSGLVVGLLIGIIIGRIFWGF